MEPIDLHHLSAIRIGDRIVYNGVGGNAFAFGEKPDLAAFALGPYPNPNVPESPITKSRTEPNFRSKESKSDVDSSKKSGEDVKGDEPDQREAPTSIMAPSQTTNPPELTVPVILEIGSLTKPKPSSDSDVDNSRISENTELDTISGVPQKEPLPSVSSDDVNTVSSSSTFANKTKTSKKPTLKEVALQAESAKSQYKRTSSWGAFSNLGTKIANSTSVLMTYTANTTMNISQRVLPLPPPPPHRKLPQIPQSPPPPAALPPPPPPPLPSETVTAASSASKTSTTSSSSKSSSASSTPTKLCPPQGIRSEKDTLPDRKPRPSPSPSPVAVGLPPILPRPPAAHLPPPLPSRPPAAMRLSCPSSPTSSIKSSVSQRPSPDDDSDSDDNDQKEFEDSASGKGTSLVFRSSGTIRLGSRSSSPATSATKSTVFAIPGSSSSAYGRRNSQSSAISGVKSFTPEKKQANHSFSTISAAVVGTSGSGPTSQQFSKSPPPSTKISNHVSISTPDLRSQRSEKQTITTTPNHSSDDEGVFEGADSSDTLSANENEVAPPSANKENQEADQTPKTKKMIKQRSLDYAKSNEIKKSNIKKFRKDTEKDESVVKNKKIWFFHKKEYPAIGSERSCLCARVMRCEFRSDDEEDDDGGGDKEDDDNDDEENDGDDDDDDDGGRDGEDDDDGEVADDDEWG
ncbi:hypothetical protein ElyMa_004231900 [Elysia marginata]|uniref:Uncharacterized protein n=1 Tax=Elysia marginata TaxID=1093978 RepID=A0AAV4GS95_9GAST|nr:hypothetical protein ElyMa_004231900 [Elysia marginata]